MQGVIKKNVIDNTFIQTIYENITVVYLDNTGHKQNAFNRGLQHESCSSYSLDNKVYLIQTMYFVASRVVLNVMFSFAKFMIQNCK